MTYFLRQNRAPSSFLNPNLSSNTIRRRSAAAAAAIGAARRPQAKILASGGWKDEERAAGENFAILDPESVDFNEFSRSQVAP